MEYNGCHTNRSPEGIEEVSGGLLPLKRTVLSEIFEQNDPEFEILDLGGGRLAAASRCICFDDTISRRCTKKNISLHCTSVSDDLLDIRQPKQVTTINEYISRKNGLSFLYGKSYNLIFSSFFLPYLGPKTLERVLYDSLRILKPGGLFIGFPLFSNSYSSITGHIEISNEYFEYILKVN